MGNVLTRERLVSDLVEIWDGEAETLDSLLPDSPAARILRRCAGQLRRLWEDTAPDEVPISAVQDRTGWSDRWLQARAAELETEGRARKRGGVWWIERAAAMAIPIKRGHRLALEGSEDPDVLADRILAATSVDAGATSVDGREP